MVNHRKITHERLGSWEKKLEREQATPALLLGIGHNTNNGAIVIVVTEDRSDAEILLFLKQAIQLLEKQKDDRYG